MIQISGILENPQYKLLNVVFGQEKRNQPIGREVDSFITFKKEVMINLWLIMF
jgi:hypothetical protein